MSINIALLFYAINVVNVKLCAIVPLIEFYLFIALSVILTLAQQCQTGLTDFFLSGYVETVYSCYIV